MAFWCIIGFGRSDYMYTLFIDTHSSNIVLVLYKDNQIVKKITQESSMSHSVYALPLIKELLEENNIELKDLGLLLVVNGPGSFTGIRIGMTIAKTIAYSLNIPIKLIDSLLIKALNIETSIKYISLEDKHGAFVGVFNKDNEVIEPYRYVKLSEYQKLSKENKYFNEVEINYEKIIMYATNIKTINPHSANPLYIKDVEVNK